MAMCARSFDEQPDLTTAYKHSVNVLIFPRNAADARWRDSRKHVVPIKQIDDGFRNKNSKCYLLINQLRYLIKQFTDDQQRVFWIICYDICCMMFYTTEHLSRNYTNEHVKVLTEQQFIEWNISLNDSKLTYVHERLENMPVELLQRYIAIMKYAEREFTILCNPPHRGIFRAQPHAETALYELYRKKKLENNIDNQHDSISEFDDIVEIIDHDVRSITSEIERFLNYQINVIKCLMGYGKNGQFFKYIRKYKVCNDEDATYILTNKANYPAIDALFRLLVFIEPTEAFYLMLQQSVSDKIMVRHYTTIFMHIDSRMNKCKITGKYFEEYVFTKLTDKKDFIEYVEKYTSIIRHAM